MKARCNGWHVCDVDSFCGTGKKRQRISSALLWRGIVARREWMDDTVSIYEGPGSHILDRLEWNYWKQRVRKRVHLVPGYCLRILYFIVHFCFSPRPYKRMRKDRRGIWCILSCPHRPVAISSMSKKINALIIVVYIQFLRRFGHLSKTFRSDCTVTLTLSEV